MDIPQIQIQRRQNQAGSKDLSVRRCPRSGFLPLGAYPGRRAFARRQRAGISRRTPTREKSIVVYCYHGNSSLGATAYLIENGFKNVASMSGGFEAWRQVYEHESD